MTQNHWIEIDSFYKQGPDGVYRLWNTGHTLPAPRWDPSKEKWDDFFEKINSCYKTEAEQHYLSGKDNYEYGFEHDPAHPSGYAVHRGTKEEILPRWEEEKREALNINASK